MGLHKVVVTRLEVAIPVVTRLEVARPVVTRLRHTWLLTVCWSAGFSNCSSGQLKCQQLLLQNRRICFLTLKMTISSWWLKMHLRPWLAVLQTIANDNTEVSAADVAADCDGDICDDDDQVVEEADDLPCKRRRLKTSALQDLEQ